MEFSKYKERVMATQPFLDNIRTDQCSVVLDGNKFVKSALLYLEKNWENPYYKCYYQHLNEYCAILKQIHNGTKSPKDFSP